MPRQPYEKNGVVYPSVTEIIGDVWNKGENFWKWKLFTPQSSKIGHTAAVKGTKQHAKLHNALTREKLSPKQKLIRQLLPGTVLLSEQRLMNEELGFGGTPDLVIESLDKKWFLIDFKTTFRRPEHLLQLGGYKLLVENKLMNPLNGGKILIPHLSGDSPYLETAWEGEIDEIPFLYLWELYKWKKENLR